MVACFLLVFFYLFMGRHERKLSIIIPPIISIFFIFLVPWLFVRIVFGFSIVDFDLSVPFTAGYSSCLYNFWIAFLRVCEHMFWNIRASGAVWIFIIGLFFLKFRISGFDVGDWFIISYLVLMIALFVGIFFFSVRPIDWHVEALPRLLLVIGTAVLPIAMRAPGKCW